MTPPNYILISTSAMFLVPALYGYRNSIHSLSTLSVLTTLCSINFWRYPIPDWRLTLDKTMATTSGIVYFLYGHNNIKNPKMKILGYLNMCSILGFYILSQILHSHNSQYWIYSHMIFHFFTTTGKLLVVHNSL
jgi:hypothetical protein